MELVLAEDLFPASLSVEERTGHWVHIFSLFNQHHLKALKSILSQKRRYREIGCLMVPLFPHHTFSLFLGFLQFCIILGCKMRCKFI